MFVLFVLFVVLSLVIAGLLYAITFITTAVIFSWIFVFVTAGILAILVWFLALLNGNELW